MKEIRLTFERLQKMRIDDEFTKQKKNFFTKMLYDRKIALIWTFKEMRKIKLKITSSIRIRTIKHKTWQNSEFHIFRAFIEIVFEMIKDQMKTKTLEYCHELYRSSWFLVKKEKSSKYRIINVIFKDKQDYHTRC